MRLHLLKELKYTPLILIVSSAFLGCKKNSSFSEDTKSKLAQEFSASNPCIYFNTNIDNSSELIEPLTSKENYEKYKRRLASLKLLEKDDIHEKHNIISDIMTFLNQIDNGSENIAKLKKDFTSELKNIREELKYKAEYYSMNFKNAISKINNNKQLNPVLFSINSDNKSIEFIDEFSKSKKLIMINSEEDFHNIKRFKDHLDYHNKNIAFESQQNNKEYFSNSSFGLSHAYMIAFMIEYFSEKNLSYSINKNDTPFQKILKAHIYVNITQLVNDVVTDTAKELLLISEIKNNFQFNLKNVIKIEKNIAKIGSKLSIGLNTANFIFDLIEIANAKTIEEKVDSEKRLAVDLAAASLGLLGEGVAYIAGETASAFASYLAVPIFGLSYGIDAYANVVDDKTKQALKMADYFYDYENNHYLLADGKVFVPNTNNSVLSLAHKNFKVTERPEHLNIVIQSIDLSQNNLIKIKFDSHFLYPTANVKSYAETQKYLDTKPYFDGTTLYISAFNENPVVLLDKENAIAVKNSFIPRNTSEENFISQKLNSADIKIQENTKIILPIQPKSYIKYKYQMTPFITYRTDKEIMSAYKLQQSGGFLFEFYNGIRGLGDYAIAELEHEYQKTDVYITLGDRSKKFITPELPHEFKNYLNYHFKVEQEGNHFLHITSGAKYNIESNGIENWFFGVDETEIKLNRINNNIIRINDIEIVFPKELPNKLYIQDKLGKIYLIDSYLNHFLPFHPKPEIDVVKEIDAIHHNTLQNLNEFIELTYKNNIETNFKYLKIKNHPQAKMIKNLKAPVFYNLSNKEVIHIDNADKYKDLNNVHIYHELNGNIIFYNEKEKILSYKDKNNKNYILKNVKEIYKNGDNVVAETSNYKHSFFEIREDGIFLVEIHQKYSDINYISEHAKEFAISDVVTLTYRDFPYFISMFAGYRYFKGSGIITGWYFNDIQNTYLLPLKTERTVSRLVGYRKENKNSASFFVFDKNKSTSDLATIKYENGKFYQFNRITLPDNDIIDDVKMYLNEPFILSKKGIIYKISDNFNAYIIAYNQNWLKKYAGKNLREVLNNEKNKKDTLYLLTNNQKAKLDLLENKIFIYTKNKLPIYNNNIRNQNTYFYDVIYDKPFYISNNYLEFNNFSIEKDTNENLVTLKYLQNETFLQSENESSFNLSNDGKFNKTEFFLLKFLQNNFNFIDIENIKGVGYVE